MNIVDTTVKLDPMKIKIIHCKKCDTTFTGKKIPAICPFCGAKKGTHVKGASEEEIESFIEAYNEATRESETEDTIAGRNYQEDKREYRCNPYENQDRGFGDYDEDQRSHYSSQEMRCPSHGTDGNREFFDQSYEDYSQISDYRNLNHRDHGSDSYQDSTEQYADDYADCFDPIGYDPDELSRTMQEKKKITKVLTAQYLEEAAELIRRKKRQMREAGLMPDSLQIIQQDIRSRASGLGSAIPAYSRFMLKVGVDNAIQMELRHPRRGGRHSIEEVRDIMQTMSIDERYWDSYYAVAGY